MSSKIEIASKQSKHYKNHIYLYYLPRYIIIIMSSEVLFYFSLELSEVHIYAGIDHYVHYKDEFLQLSVSAVIDEASVSLHTGDQWTVIKEGSSSSVTLSPKFLTPKF